MDVAALHGRRHAMLPYPRTALSELRSFTAHSYFHARNQPKVAQATSVGWEIDMGLFSSYRTFRAFTMAGAMCFVAGQAFAGNADWPMVNYNAHGTRYNDGETTLNRQNVASLQLAWKADVGDTGYHPSTPAIFDGAAYLGSSKGQFYALNAVTGKTIWSVTLGSGQLSSPAVANGIVYVAEQNGMLDALSIASGNKLWSAPLDAATNNSFMGSPVTINGRVFVHDGVYATYAFDARTGGRLWKQSIPNMVALELAPSVADGIVYVHSENEGVFAFDAKSGAQLWNASSEWGNQSVISEEHKVYVFLDVNLHADILDGITGRKIGWACDDLGGMTGFVLGQNHLLCIDSASSRISRTNVRSGVTKVKITNPIVYAGGNFNLTAAGGMVFINGAVSIAAYEPKSGNQLWSASVPGSTVPVVANGMIYAVSGSAGSIYAYALKKAGGTR